jgi:hypothetical protein
MPSSDELRGLTGRRVALDLTPAGGGGTVRGRIVGTLDAADGLVVVVERDDQPGRASLNYQHVSEVRLDPA